MEADGEPLFIAQAPISGGIHCGKVKVGGHGKSFFFTFAPES